VFDEARTPEGFAKVTVDEETGTWSGPGVPIWHRTRSTSGSGPMPGLTPP
jgi:hypothetical protein